MTVITFPTRLQASTPPTPAEIRQRQDRNLVWAGWEGDAGMNGKLEPINPHWSGPHTKPSLQNVYTLLWWYEKQGVFAISHPYTVEFFNGGFFSHLFKITTASPWVHPETGRTLPSEILLRITCAWAPFYGTESEVATMTQARMNAIPVPEIFFFDSSANNPFGYEFSIMELIPDSEPLAGSRWEDSISDEQIMVHWRKVWNLDFDLSGSLYCDWSNDNTFFVGPMVHMDLFAPAKNDSSNHPLKNLGPFPTWESYALALIEARECRDWDAVRVISWSDTDSLPPSSANTHVSSDYSLWGSGPLVDDTDDDDSMDVDDDIIPIYLDVERGPPNLRAVVDEISAMADDSSEGKIAFKPRMTHHDLHRANILVNKTYGTIAALIDWEGVRIEPAGMVEFIAPKAVDDYSMPEEVARKQLMLPDEYFVEKAREVRNQIVKRLEEI